MTKMSLITLDKLHVILVKNDKWYWMKQSTNINSSIVYILSHVTNLCNYFSHNSRQMMCCHMSQYLIIYNINIIIILK